MEGVIFTVMVKFPPITDSYSVVLTCVESVCNKSCCPITKGAKIRADNFTSIKLQFHGKKSDDKMADPHALADALFILFFITLC